MENTRALFLIDKSGLNDLDKEFLKKHLEVHEEILHSLESEILQLRDIIDYGKYVDEKVMAARESLIKLFEKRQIETEEDLRNLLESVFRKLYS